MHALSIESTRFTTRFIAFICLTFCFLIHGVFLNWGLRLQNILGFFKLFALLAIAMTGMFHVIGVPGFELQAGVDVPRNFERDTFWEGSGTGANAFVTGMTNVIWYARFLYVQIPPGVKQTVLVNTQVIHRVLKCQLCIIRGTRPCTDY
jgi:amino acid transporter